MRLHVIALFVTAVLLATVNAAAANVDVQKTRIDSLSANVPATRLLRTAKTPAEEERVVVGRTLPDLLKRGGQKITDSIRVRSWLTSTKTNTAENIFSKKLKLDGGVEQALTNKNLNTWFTYVNLYNKKNPDKKISVIGMFTKTYGDAALARALELGKNGQNTQKVAFKLSGAQQNAWKAEGKSIDDVFKLLKLDTAGDQIFTRLELSAWTIYIRKTIGGNPRITAVAALESHYGAANLARMFATAEPPIKNLRLLTSRLENTMLQQWLGKKRTVDEVFKLLKLDDGVDTLLANPNLKTWMGYVSLFNAKNPSNQVHMIKTLANVYGVQAASKMLVAGKRDPSTSKLAKEIIATV